MPQAAEAPGDPKTDSTTYRGLTAPALGSVHPSRNLPPRLGRFRIRLMGEERLQITDFYRPKRNATIDITHEKPNVTMNRRGLASAVPSSSLASSSICREPLEID